MEWPTIPECFLPESLRGASVIDINVNALDECMDFFHDEGHDAASTSHNFLERSEFTLFDLWTGPLVDSFTKFTEI